jgi:hypothetical protein
MVMRYVIALVGAAIIWGLVLWAVVLWAAEAQSPTDVLESKRNEFLSQMQALDMQWQLIPYKYKELEEKVRVIDQELEKRGVRKNEVGNQAQPEKKPAK